MNFPQRPQTSGRLPGLLRLARILLAPILLALLLPALPVAAELDEAVTSGLEAELARETFYPWYSTDTQTARPVRLTPTHQPQTPQRWEWWDKWFSWKNTGTGTWNGWGTSFGEVFRVLAWILLAALVIYMLYLLNDARQRHASVPRGAWDDEVDEAGEAARIENLPVELPTRKGDLLQHARALYERGDLEQAVVYLFSYQLVTLDKGAWLQLERGKTNRQYLRELQTHPDLKAILAQTTTAFEDVFFGKHPLAPPRFEQIWKQLDRFHQLVAPRTVG